MKKLLKSLNNKKTKIAMLCISASSISVPVFAAEGTTSTATDMTPITDAIKAGIGDTKTEFLAILGVVVVGGMAFFGIKYAINNGIGFFAKLSKKG